QERFLGKPADPVDPARALERLAAGVFHLRRACEIDVVPAHLEGQRLWAHDWTVAREHLTFAWLLETGAHLAERMNTPRLFGLEQPVFKPEESRALERWIDDLGSADAAEVAPAQQELAAPERLENAISKLMQHTASPNSGRKQAVAMLLERYWIERSIAEYWLA